MECLCFVVIHIMIHDYWSPRFKLKSFCSKLPIIFLQFSREVIFQNSRQSLAIFRRKVNHNFKMLINFSGNCIGKYLLVSEGAWYLRWKYYLNFTFLIGNWSLAIILFPWSKYRFTHFFARKFQKITLKTKSMNRQIMMLCFQYLPKSN